MNNQTFNVSIQFIIDALQARYDNVKDSWGSDASDELSDDEINEKWQEYVINNACLYNDNYACLSF